MVGMGGWRVGGWPEWGNVGEGGELHVECMLWAAHWFEDENAEITHAYLYSYIHNVAHTDVVRETHVHLQWTWVAHVYARVCMW